MLKPSVGETVLASSPLMRFTIVVFPALSSPLRAEGSAAVTSQPGCELAGLHLSHCPWACQCSALRRRSRPDAAAGSSTPAGTHTRSTRISFSLCLTLRMMLSSPMAATAIKGEHEPACNYVIDGLRKSGARAPGCGRKKRLTILLLAQQRVPCGGSSGGEAAAGLRSWRRSRCLFSILRNSGFAPRQLARA